MSRITLIAILALLQLVAPLVHAHSGVIHAPAGIHLPGLEIINTEHNKINYSATVNHDASEGVIISISSGIKQSFLMQDSSAKLYIYKQIKLCINEIIAKEINFSPHITAFFSSLSCRTKSPRAPPVIPFN